MMSQALVELDDLIRAQAKVSALPKGHCERPAKVSAASVAAASAGTPSTAEASEAASSDTGGLSARDAFNGEAGGEAFTSGGKQHNTRSRGANVKIKSIMPVGRVTVPCGGDSDSDWSCSKSPKRQSKQHDKLNLLDAPSPTRSPGRRLRRKGRKNSSTLKEVNFPPEECLRTAQVHRRALFPNTTDAVLEPFWQVPPGRFVSASESPVRRLRAPHEGLKAEAAYSSSPCRARLGFLGTDAPVSQRRVAAAPSLGFWTPTMHSQPYTGLAEATNGCPSGIVSTMPYPSAASAVAAAAPAQGPVATTMLLVGTQVQVLQREFRSQAGMQQGIVDSVLRNALGSARADSHEVAAQLAAAAPEIYSD